MTYIPVKQIVEKMLGGTLVQSIGFWLDGGRYECEFAVDCKKEAGFQQTKWLEFVVLLEDHVMIF